MAGRSRKKIKRALLAEQQKVAQPAAVKPVVAQPAPVAPTGTTPYYARNYQTKAEPTKG